MSTTHKPAYGYETKLKKIQNVVILYGSKRVRNWWMDWPPTRYQNPRTSNPLNKATGVNALSNVTIRKQPHETDMKSVPEWRQTWHIETCRSQQTWNIRESNIEPPTQPFSDALNPDHGMGPNTLVTKPPFQVHKTIPFWVCEIQQPHKPCLLPPSPSTEPKNKRYKCKRITKNKTAVRAPKHHTRRDTSDGATTSTAYPNQNKTRLTAEPKVVGTAGNRTMKPSRIWWQKRKSGKKESWTGGATVVRRWKHIDHH